MSKTCRLSDIDKPTNIKPRRHSNICKPTVPLPRRLSDNYKPTIAKPRWHSNICQPTITEPRWLPPSRSSTGANGAGLRRGHDEVHRETIAKRQLAKTQR